MAKRRGKPSLYGEPMKTISVAIRQSTIDQINAHAKDTGKKKAAITRRAIELYMATVKRKAQLGIK